MNGQPMMMVAQVTLNGTNLQATINPGLPEGEKLQLALKCAEMFAKMAGDMVAASGGDDVPKKPQIIVPKAGLQL